MKNKTLITVLRWIAVLPGAILASGAIYLLLVLLLIFSETSIVSTILESIFRGEFTLILKPYSPLGETNIFSLEIILLSIIYTAISAATFVYAGQKIAPTGKHIVATVLATTRSLVGIISIIGLVISSGECISYLSVISGIAGAIAAAIYIWKEET